MPHQSYMPSTNEGVGNMLTVFNNNIQANSNALATKYGVTSDEINRVAQAQSVWMWFDAVLAMARGWGTSLTASRDALFTGVPGASDPMPDSPVLPPVPNAGGPPPGPAVIEHAFFTFFGDLVARIKHNAHYDVADGKLLGIEGAAQPPPNPAVVPVAHAETLTAGHPEVSCVKGVFQGYDVFLTRPGQVRRNVGFSTARRFVVSEPLPAPGVAEVWIFEVMYRYKNAAFGQMSQPVNVTVRG